MEPAAPGRSAQRTHTARAGNVQRQPGAHCTSPGHRTHQFVSLLEALGQTGVASRAALGMTMTRELLQRSSTAVGGEVYGADRPRQDGTMNQQTLPSNGSRNLAGAAPRPGGHGEHFGV